MTTAMLTLLVLGLVVYGLERNNARSTYPHSHLAGSHGIKDRDVERVRADLRALDEGASRHSTDSTPHIRQLRTPTAPRQRSRAA